ncbi:MAG: hypothetical protein CVV41_14830 [Candidatus Riflebacteria bacterium HGW-Riflebacteria-1]|jgi:hypothetical protein|nr:MAG: hypothetical protein CVV41_14830 [Candidatus Riflebacteria bacterium HGW-Riflebacteria-1]
MILAVQKSMIDIMHRAFNRGHRRGFLLGVVLLVALLMAVFIFSFNSIVRQRNIQAHHLMISETANYLAISGLRLLSDKIGSSFESTIKTSCPELFTKTAAELGSSINLSSSNPVCADVSNDFQNFLNTFDELREPGIMGDYPKCLSMDITLENLQALTPDTTPEQFQAGRDPIEKCGQLLVKCTVEYRGLRRQATMSRQFRVVSMIPGAFSRFSLFVKKTPYPDSYNALGVKFDGTVDTAYVHPPAGGKTFTGPLQIFNGTNSVVIDSAVLERNAMTDKEHLRSRGWVFLGPAGAAADEAVFIKIPSGFGSAEGGHFMLGWPSVSAMPVLAPEIIEDATNFASDSDFAEHDYDLGAKYQGFYTWEEGNPFGAGGKNLWPNLTTGAAFVPADHLRSASTWLYPYGNQSNESRTLLVGPVLAGFLKFFFFRGSNTTTSAEYRGIWGGMSETSFNDKVAANQTLQGFADLWDGPLAPPIYGLSYFINGYESFKKLMPYNSLPSPSSTLPGNGVAFNLIFDFMKYQRGAYPNLAAAPSIAAATYDSENFLVPQAEEMRNCPVKGVHPYDEISIYFNENGQYDPNASPDNCFFSGNLRDITIFDSNLLSNRITHKLDLRKCGSTAEEQEAMEKFLFKRVGAGAVAVNESQKSGIFLVTRRIGATDSFADALILSKRPLKLVKPLIVIVDKGSLILSQDITSPLSDGAPSVLCSLALINGHFYIDGAGSSRVIHAYLASLHPSSGRLLRPPTVGGSPGRFQIHGGLALTEIGLYDDPMNDPLNHLGTTMSHFTQGGEVHYNPRFNPSSSAAADARTFVLEDTAGRMTIEGAAL